MLDLDAHFPEQLDEVVSVRMNAYGTLPQFSPTAASRQKMRQWLAQGVAMAWSSGQLHGWRNNGHHCGHLFWWFEEHGFHGAPVQQIVLDWEPQDALAEAHAMRALRDLLSEFGPHAEVQLLPFQHRATELLLQHGFHAMGDVLMGQCDVALERLKLNAQEPRSLEHLGLEASPARPNDVEALLALQRRVFERDTWACWFGRSERYIDRLVRPMLVHGGDALSYCLWRDSELLGSFRAMIERNNPYWGPIAGFDIVLAPEIQRRGVLKTAYLMLFEALLEQGINRFKGGTLQPAVKGLGEVIGRERILTTLHTRDVPRMPERTEPVSQPAD